MKPFRRPRAIAWNVPPRRLPLQSGISSLEVIGALAAVSAGAWLGAMYLGVDLREAWNLAAGRVGFPTVEVTIDESELAGNPASSPDGDDASDRNTLQDATTVEDAADAATDGKMQDEIDRLRLALERLENAQDPKQRRVQQGTTNQPKAENASKPNAVGKRTLAFWNKLNQIMLKEEQMRTPPSSGLTPGNAGTFLADRGKASRYAAITIRKLPTNNVDSVVGNLARDLAKWYDRGADLNDQAMQLFNEAHPATRRGPLGQSWSTAEKQHQNEVALLNRRGDAARRKMTSKYGLAFPDLR